MAYEFASRLETFPNYRKFETTFAGRPFVVETGKMCGLSNGSAMIRYGETCVLCNVTMSDKPRDGGDHAEPDAFLRLFAKHRAGHRHEHDVERRDKARLARARRPHAKLLQVDRKRQNRAAAKPSAQQRALFLRAVLFARVDALHDGQQRQQYQHRGNGAQRVEAEAPKMRRAEALRDKCAAPDQGRDQRQHHLPDFRIFHSCLPDITHVTMQNSISKNRIFRKKSGRKICTERRHSMQIDEILLLRMNRQ